MMGEQNSEKASVRELQEQIDLLQMRLILAEPAQIALLRESHRSAQLHIRDLRFFVDGIERALTRMHARLAKVDANHQDLEELAQLFQRCRERLYVNLFPEPEQRKSRRPVQVEPAQQPELW